ncbi:hypothetical protein QU42_31565 [Bradyrhizobium sp. UASWS1016]|jgi:hypothetical protein|nr:hypothetical protein CWS35_21060 [Bradyrhizobium sp. SK17]KIU45740.1 hypothetical protein QU41_22870 [Bradyrhizobium elkanii]OCX27242.1 hypothetical protein QU42_31565 [Bradyrhizobium sp. UASWS1016]
MVDSLPLRLKRKLWTHFLGVDSWVGRTGDFRTRERHGLVSRPYYVYGMLRAADHARYVGASSVTVVEFGVASGRGLLNMIDCAELITAETGVAFRIVGFDTGAGLPSIDSYKDHPEIWNPGDFAMEDRTSLEKKIGGRAEIIWGNIDQTIDGFTGTLGPQSPLGFIAIDVDIYSASKSALRCLTGDPEKYLPAMSMYFDDVSFFFANKWCGELAAIEEFNAEHAMRKIDRDRSLPGLRPKAAAAWYQAMYVGHVLDHPARQSPANRKGLTIKEHAAFMSASALS